MRVLDEPGDRGLGHVAEQQRRHRDAELGAGQLHVEVSHRADARAGPARCPARPSPRASCGGWRSGRTRPPRRTRWRAAAAAPTSEVAGDHGPPRRGRRPRRGGAARWRPGGRRAPRPRRASPSCSKPSPTSGMRPERARARTRPASRSRPPGPTKPQASNTSSGCSVPSRSHSPGRCTRVSRGVGPVVLVVDLADDLLEDVLERDDAGGAAVLVDDDRRGGCPSRRRSARRSARSRVSGTTNAGAISGSTGRVPRSS